MPCSQPPPSDLLESCIFVVLATNNGVPACSAEMRCQVLFGLLQPSCGVTTPTTRALLVDNLNSNLIANFSPIQKKFNSFGSILFAVVHVL
jgi:hypothetical protein